MNRFLIAVVLTLVYISAFSQNVLFIEKPWNEVLALAKEKNKPIFVDVYIQACSPCKSMDKEVFTNQAFAEFINDSLISYKIDAGLKENRWITSAYHINAFPTLLYFSSAGDMIYKSVGATDVKGVTDITRKVLALLNTPKPISVWEREYESNKGNAVFLFDYISKLNESGLYTGNVIEEYLSLILEKERYNKKNLDLILANAGSLAVKGIASHVLLTCRDTLLTQYTEEETNEIIDSGIMMYAMGLLESAAIDTNESTVDYAVSIASQIKNPYMKEPGYEMQMRGYYYGLINDNRRFSENAVDYITRYYINGTEVLNSDTMLTVSVLNKYAMNFFNVINDTEMLTKATEWCDRCLELSEVNLMVKENLLYEIFNTKANLLYKMGKTSESLKIKEQALATMPINEYTVTDRSRFEDELVRMKAGEKTWY